MVLPTPVSVPVMKSVCFIRHHQSRNAPNTPSKPLTESTRFNYAAQLVKRELL
jgi:hypothetical protein